MIKFCFLERSLGSGNKSAPTYRTTKLFHDSPVNVVAKIITLFIHLPTSKGNK